MTKKPHRDASVEHEPHRRGGSFSPDPSEARAERVVDRAAGKETEDSRVEHSVWDEPALSGALSGPAPPGALTYRGWLEAKVAGTGPAYSWTITLATAAVAGPLAVAGAFCDTLTSARTFFGIVAVTVFGPVLEEVMKIAATLWIVEKRPFLFRSRLQIAVCVLAGALVFAAIENVMYLEVYIAGPTPGLARWRWSVCVAMHMGCSLVAGLGLMRIWRGAMTTRSRPQLSSGAPYLMTAAIIHGTYNAFAVLLDAMDFRF